MQKQALLLGFIAASIAVTGFAASSYAAREKRAPEQRAEMMIKRMDTNKDNKVSLDEMQARVSTVFTTFDADKNGQVSRDEIKVRREAFRDARKAWREAKNEAGADKDKAMENLHEARPGMFPGLRGKGFARADADKNGSLSLQEVSTVTETMFKRRDKNGDGFIDASDFTKKI
ncbi:EF-hand domain-containing protein [Pararhizobium antarcticum]|uniref:EF-hand domain-containing protein n=1 Tax=Pararhizobium antarcticum TaxID=1798805 RepID=A0A657LME6_9HYPH|nr:EF-hand domain-containing protein [Pararhizobium antarcticum]OJF90484.1 hypothetical protein AX760_07640 [Pararhizobium antarcticum]OJF98560.1 hypothetical protein AX761_02225 [Rhizobium sp. 58]